MCIFLWGCEELVSPEFLSSPPKLVVEGWISDRPGESYVRLSKTTDYNSPLRPVPVTNARVILKEDTSSITLSQASPGNYTPSAPLFAGKAGKGYSLEVQLDGEVYQAFTSMPSLAPVDSMKSVFFFGDGEKPAGYYVSYYQQDPPQIRNFYRWRVYANEKPMETSRIQLRSDENVNGKYLEIELPIAFSEGDSVRLKLSAITEKHYRYLRSINALLEAGNPSEAVPENPVSNIKSTNGALGFFGAGQTVELSITIKP